MSMDQQYQASQRTLKYYIKATEERKKRALFKYMEKVSALPKKNT